MRLVPTRDLHLRRPLAWRQRPRQAPSRRPLCRDRARGSVAQRHFGTTLNARWKDLQDYLDLLNTSPSESGWVTPQLLMLDAERTRANVIMR